MNELLTLSAAQQARAEEIVRELRLRECWGSVGARVNLVGSVAMGLALGKRDIDLHVYTDPFVVADSFAAVGRIAADPRVKSVQYANLMAEEDRCLEWHAQCEIAPGETWKLDMIHIAPDSRYVGFFERVAVRISVVLNEEMRLAILGIKRELGEARDIPGIEIYQAVLEGGVRDAAGLRVWRERHPPRGINCWMP